MDLSSRARISAMMFLQYFVWGAWFVPFATYLTRNGLEDHVGTIYSAQGWAAIAAPLFVGAIADRYFSAEKVMGILHLFAGALLFLLSSIGADAGTDVLCDARRAAGLHADDRPIQYGRAERDQRSRKQFPAFGCSAPSAGSSRG
jgi:MFS family permease